MCQTLFLCSGWLTSESHQDCHARASRQVWLWFLALCLERSACHAQSVTLHLLMVSDLTRRNTHPVPTQCPPLSPSPAPHTHRGLSALAHSCCPPDRFTPPLLHLRLLLGTPFMCGSSFPLMLQSPISSNLNPSPHHPRLTLRHTRLALMHSNHQTDVSPKQRQRPRADCDQ